MEITCEIFGKPHPLPHATEGGAPVRKVPGRGAGRSTAKASHLEQLPRWKTRDIEMSLWKSPPAHGNSGRQQRLPRNSLVTDEVLHPIGKVQPLLIGLNVPDQVECSRSG